MARNWLKQPGEGPRFITVFADASHCPDTLAYGWAAWVKYGNPATTVRRAGGGVGHRTSNESEILALQNGINLALSLGDEVVRGAIVVAQSDCTGALSKVDVSGLWRAGVRHVKLKHVKGHRGYRDPRSSVNTWCDVEAGKFMREHRKRVQHGRL